MRFAAAALLAWLTLPVSAEVRESRFASKALERDVAYAVDLPPGYAASGKAYPVIYALHGLFESHRFWEGRGLAGILHERIAAKQVPELIVVAIDGGNSFFANASGGRFEDLVTRDLVEHVEATYRVVPRRGGRALLGVSMGGYAALRIAFKHAGQFQAVATHSAMLLKQPPTRDAGAGRGQMQAIQRVFGDPIDPALWVGNDPLALALRLDAASAPAISFDCGAADRYGLAAGHQELHARLETRGVAHRFELPPGDHGYEYVRSALAEGLGFLGRALQTR